MSAVYTGASTTAKTQSSPPASTSNETPVAGTQVAREPIVAQAGLPENPLGSTLARDALLSHAYRIYNSPNNHLPPGLSHIPLESTSTDPTSPSHAYSTQLVPLLSILKSLHPQHLPTLLLYSCVLYAVGDLNGSLALNSDILRIDPNYVEAMSNIGTILRTMGRPQEAEAWWWKAIRLRPVFWDATDNLLGVLCVTADQNSIYRPRYEDALYVCSYVQSHILSDNGELLINVPPSQRHRVQNLLHTHGSLQYIMDSPHARSRAISLHLKALDFIMRPPCEPNNSGNANVYTAVDVVVAVCVAGLLASAGPDTPLASDLARALGIPDASRFSVGILEQSFNILEAVSHAGPRLVDTLLRMGGGILPMTLLLPDQVARLPCLLFASSAGALPGLYDIPREGTPPSESPPDTLKARQMTASVLLTLARVFQHVSTSSQTTLSIRGTLVRASTSLVLLFYYLALAIHPSPATCNNIGIILSTVSLSIMTTDGNGHQEVVNGQLLAYAYYKKGLSHDNAHPHLLTNLGSLLKDQGKIDEAIWTYAQAIQAKPDFDVALANMGNAIKDIGRPQESIPFYQRAVEANPEFQEAICGLANALGAVCDWRGRGGFEGSLVLDQMGCKTTTFPEGWINKVVEICDEQLLAGYSYGVGVIQSHCSLKQWLGTLETAFGRPFRRVQRKRWTKMLQRFFTSFDRQEKRVNEGGVIIKLMENVIRITQRRWYIDAYGQRTYSSPNIPSIPVYERLGEFELQKYRRPRIPTLGVPPVPSVLPFHTFTYPLSPRTTRLISYRNALRISYMTQTQSWLPAHVYPPPPPLVSKLKIGYVSNDLNNHPLAHLMQSVFGFHDRTKFDVYVYATSASDGSQYRQKIQTESQHFLDVSAWSTREIVERIVMDGIHLLVNLGGYTKGARNDIFAARPAPVQLQFMGFAGTLAAEWCDYLVSDVISCPPETCAWERLQRRSMQDHFVQLELESDADIEVDPESLSEDWMYTEHVIYMPHTFFVTDHKQSAPERPTASGLSLDILWRQEERTRSSTRQGVFPQLDRDTFIFANFNQLYKIDPSIFASWLRILDRVPNSILWLLRFPPAGEEHLIRTAQLWAGSDVASRVMFTDVSSKDEHLRRARVADLVLDTVECNAHTIAADVLWAGTPIITWPKYKSKMCSRVAASIANATGYGSHMVVDSLEEYEARAIRYAQSLSYVVHQEGDTTEQRGQGELIDLRRNLYLRREDMPLFDTRRWTRNLEKGLSEAWRRWVAGTCFVLDHNAEKIDEFEECDDSEKESQSIWVKEDTQ
ncbi:glycosyl transferase family 41-domain-containing protein [Hysterangium stoloniferum]|nr:glycosyl transferase family 41-domain-containing protein [Hysterangium stoloniferum]